MAKAKRKQQTGKTVLEKRRAKKARREALAQDRQRSEAVRPAS